MMQPIPFIDLHTQRERIEPHVTEAILEVLKGGAYILGPQVAALEDALATFTKARHVASCSSGTDALVLALRALDVKPGDAVFVPSFTFVATAEAVMLVGATPVFVDVDQKTFNLCPNSLSEAIHATKKEGTLTPKGIIPVDLFGLPADHARLQAIAQQESLWTIVDAAQSLGASINGEMTVNAGTIAATSFFPAKPLGCYGDGGAVFTNHAELDARLRSLRVHGQGKTRYAYEEVGITGRLDTIQAAILLEKLKIFPDELKARQKIADIYSQQLKNVAEVPVLLDGLKSSWAQYTIKVPQRDALMAFLKEKGIPTMVYYPKPLYSQPPYLNCPRAPNGLPSTERLCNEVLSLPMHPYLNTDDQEKISSSVRDFFSASL